MWLGLGFNHSVFAQSSSVERQAEPVLMAQHKIEKGKLISEEEKVAQLINYVRHLLNATFIRNGKDYTPQKAADHLQSKYNKHKKRAKTAHDFVDRLASESKTSEPYLIRFSDGSTVKLGELLNKELARIESQ